MHAFTSPRRALALVGAAAALMVPITLVPSSPARAHADVTQTAPGNGAVLRVAPAQITVRFDDPISVSGRDARVVNAAGTTVPATATASGSTLTVRPRKTLEPGSYAVEWTVAGHDGHKAPGVISFSIGRPLPQGEAKPLRTVPAVRTSLSGGTSGPLSIDFAHSARSGEVRWSHPALSAPIAWSISGNGRTAHARGVLPFAGAWTMTADLVGRNGSTTVVKATASLR